MSEQRVLRGDCLRAMRLMDADSFDAIVTDPPYGLSSGPNATAGFMGKAWDARVPGPEYWREALRVAKPGAHLLAAGGTRTYHRLACAIEDAGWEIRDALGLLGWITGQGFPKSRSLRDIGEEWAGFGSAMKPAWEPVIRARKPLTVIPSLAILEESEHLIGGLLCRLLSSAKSVELLSSSSPSGFEQASVSALLIAAVLHGSESDEWCATMATCSSPEAVSTCLSIAWSWSECLAVLLGQESRSTTSTETELTTILRTLNSCLSGIMPACIMEAVSRPVGGESSATGAGRSSTDGSPKSSLILPHTAAALASLRLTMESVGSAGFDFTTATRAASSALSGATRLLAERAPQARTPRSAIEPIILARKPLVGTLARNVREHGCGGLNIGACRVGTEQTVTQLVDLRGDRWGPGMKHPKNGESANPPGRWPANLVLSHAPECRCVGTRKVKASQDVTRNAPGLKMSYGNGATGHGYADPDGTETVEAWECAPGCPVAELDRQSGVSTSSAALRQNAAGRSQSLSSAKTEHVGLGYSDTGGASRFFATFEPEYDAPFLYCAKASTSEREHGLRDGDGTPDAHNLSSNACGRCGLRVKANGSGKKCECGDLRETVKLPARANSHPTVKPVALMEWLLRLVTPPGGRVFDPFCGSGTTLVAARRLGITAVGIDLDAHYCEIARARIAAAETLKLPKRKPVANDAPTPERPTFRARRNGQLTLPLAAGDEWR